MSINHMGNLMLAHLMAFGILIRILGYVIGAVLGIMEKKMETTI